MSELEEKIVKVKNVIRYEYDNNGITIHEIRDSDNIWHNYN